MTTKADQYRANALHEVGEDYVWGAEGTGGVAGDDDYDCSGFVWAMLNDVGVKMPRLTAHGYMKRGEKIMRPAKVGADFAVMVNSSGHATHIIPFIGKDDTVEARGKAYGVLRSTVAAVNKRGGLWYRFGDVDLGALTSSKPKPTPRTYPGHLIRRGHKHHDEVRWVQRRLNAHGSKLAVDGDFGPKTAKAVAAFKRKAFGRAISSTVGPKTWVALGKG